MRTSALRLGALVALLALDACRTLPPPPLPASAPWEQRRPQLQALQHFQLKGRIALSAAGNGFNANLRWQQRGSVRSWCSRVRSGWAARRSRPAGEDLQIINAHGEHIGNDAARAELRARLGFDVPLPSLRYWVLGVPDPATPAQESLDDEQRLASLTQDGWQVTYGAYVAAGAETLPARLTLERDTVRVRLLVEDWQL